MNDLNQHGIELTRPILVSACLIGLPCRYDGRAQPCEKVLKLARTLGWIPVCPEILGGLSTPRAPAERIESRVVTKFGEDVTAAFRKGAEQTLYLARLYNIRAALFKSRSPSCGRHTIYDGSFTGRKITGQGVTTQLLLESGLAVYSEEEIDALMDALKF